MTKLSYCAVGDCAVSIYFAQTICPAVNRQILSLRRALEASNTPGIVETAPTYCALMVYYDPCVIRYEELVARLEQLEEAAMPQPVQRIYEIPVLYGGEYGPDLETVAKTNRLSPQAVIRLHTAPDYLIYMLGFLAGFPYLGGMDERIATPRLETPRIRIEGGSVGVAGGQTGIYPVASPGGWQLIGRTPLRLYDPQRVPATLLEAGGYVRFRAINEAEFADLAARVAQGEQCCKSWEMEHGN